ncbi:MAG TPA: MGMT family protein [Xanthomonadales bacterium]|nr:MGMT family protein [Xanthomonadales bacterium]
MAAKEFLRRLPLRTHGTAFPCRRVVGSNGDLTGYGGGLWRKQYLLSLEQSESFSLF